jgi:hypothetical protein
MNVSQVCTSINVVSRKTSPPQKSLFSYLSLRTYPNFSFNLSAVINISMAVMRNYEVGNNSSVEWVFQKSRTFVVPHFRETEKCQHDD